MSDMLTEFHYMQMFQLSPFPRMVMRVQQSPDATNAQFTVLVINKAAGTYFDLDIENTKGKGPLELFNEEVGDHLYQAFRTCLKTKQTITISSIPEMIGKSDMQAFLLNPVLDQSGAVELIDVIARPNLPENIQLQRERDDAIGLLSSIFDSSSVGILVLDRHKRIIRANDEFIKDFGWDRTTLVGRKFSEIMGPEYAKDHDVDKLDTKSETGEQRVKHVDGRFIDVLMTTAFLELSHGRRFEIVTLLDMSERKAMMKRLQSAKEEADDANRAKSAFLANMSHELRTPLNAIIGFSELIKSEIFGALNNEKYSEYLTDIHFSAQHLLDIINDVLDMSKIEAGKVELFERDISIQSLFESVERIIRDRAKAADLVLEMKIERDAPDIYADRRFMRQILINLLSNAIKFSPKGAQIFLKAQKIQLTNGQETMRISVVDFGCGIPEEKLGTVLEPFGQANDVTKNNGQGTGLGLAIAKAMMELHQGTLSLKSEVGKGTSVHLDLPPERLIFENSNPNVVTAHVVPSPSILQERKFLDDKIEKD